MKKHYLKLTKEQKERNIIFSSELFPSGKVHELTKPITSDEWKEFERKRELLLDDKFFNNSGYKYNIIRR